MDMAFSDVTRLLHRDEGRYSARIDASWQQGRSVFGGLVMALVARAARSMCPKFRLRTLSMEFIAPVRVGEVEIRVQAERSGILVQRQSHRIVQNGELVGLATVTLARDRSRSGDFHAARMPEVPPADQVPAIRLDSGMPAFTRHLEYRPCLGAPPGSGADDSRSGGWVSLIEHREPGDSALIAALLDCWYPTWICRMDHLAQMATVSMHAHFMTPWGDGPGSTPVLIENLSDMAIGGYATETNQLWTSEGVLIARAQQLIALLER